VLEILDGTASDLREALIMQVLARVKGSETVMGQLPVAQEANV